MKKQSAARFCAVLCLALLTGACASTGLDRMSADIDGMTPGEHRRLEAAMAKHIEILASEKFGGRKPGTKGEELTLEYLTAKLSRAGFSPGSNNPANPWLSTVLLETTRPKSERLEFAFADRSVVLQADQVATMSELPRQSIQGKEVLFVGRSEANFSAEQVNGRIILALSKDGRWPTSVGQIRKGALAAIVVTDDEADLVKLRDDTAESSPQLPGQEDPALIMNVTGKAMATAFGETRWADLVSRAAAEDFGPEVLEAHATIEVTREIHTVPTNNFIARLPGKIPESGAILLMAHWDHLGTCRKEGVADRVCNGAVDNASGVSLVIELARRIAAEGPHDRDIWVLATTAEEMGMLGANAFAEAPPFPLKNIVAAFNFDTVAVAPDGKKVGFLGQGETALDPIILDVLAKTKRELAPSEPIKRFLKRQDGWALLKRGVPSVVISSALGDMEAMNGFMKVDYHKPSDDSRHLVLGGAVADLLLHQVLINRLASTSQYPIR